MVTNEENKNNESNKNVIRDDLDDIQAVKNKIDDYYNNKYHTELVEKPNYYYIELVNKLHDAMFTGDKEKEDEYLIELINDYDDEYFHGKDKSWMIKNNYPNPYIKDDGVRYEY